METRTTSYTVVAAVVVVVIASVVELFSIPFVVIVVRMMC